MLHQWIWCILLLICDTSGAGIVFYRYISVSFFFRYVTLVEQVQSFVYMLHQCIRCILWQICYTNVGSVSLLQICYTNVGRCSLLQICYSSEEVGLFQICYTSGEGCRVLLICCTNGAVFFVDMLHQQNRRSLLQICCTSGAGVVFCRYATLVEKVVVFC